MKIFIDANIIRNIGFNFQRPQYLKVAKLCVDHGYSIVTHQVSKKETESQILENFEKKFSTIKKNLNSLKRTASSDKTVNEIISSIEKIKEKENLWKEDYLKPFHEWLSRCNHETVMLDDKGSNAVFESYFNGRDAFREKKSRKDFPDAFIFEGIKKKFKKDKDSILIINDGTLSNAFINAEFKNVFTSMENFLNSPPINEISYEFAFQELGKVYGDSIYKQVTEIKTFETFISEIILNHDWYNTDLSDEDSNESEPTITELYDIHNLELQDILDIEDNELRLSYSFDADVDFEYYIYKSEALSNYDDFFETTKLEDWNKHYFLASTHTTLSLTIEIAIFFNNFKLGKEDSTNQIAERLIESATHDIEYVYSFPIHTSDL